MAAHGRRVQSGRLNGPCAGKQLQVSLHAADGSQPYYHEFFISVQS